MKGVVVAVIHHYFLNDKETKTLISTFLPDPLIHNTLSTLLLNRPYQQVPFHHKNVFPIQIDHFLYLTYLKRKTIKNTTGKNLFKVSKITLTLFQRLKV